MSSLATYRSKAKLVQVLSTLLILILPFLNVARLDIPTLRLHLFGAVLWADEFYIPFLALMLALWLIVFFSMLYGRVWCGWMCPQTVLSQLVRWFERLARRVLGIRGRQVPAPKRILIWTLVSLQLAAVCLVVGFNLVAYFVDPYRMLRELASGTLSPLIRNIILGIAAFMFVDILFWRERFCLKACPYGMMQLLVTDSRTQVVLYDKQRTDDCIDCKACVKCCVMQIDIRQSPYQTECIYCGDCVDACDRILGAMKKPGLITFSWGETQRGKDWFHRLGLVDTKRWIILGLTTLYAVGLVFIVHSRQPLSISASGDRSTLYRLTADGRVCNDFSIRVQNRSQSDGQFRIAVVSSAGSADDWTIVGAEGPLSLDARESRTLRLALSTEGKTLSPGPNRIRLALASTTDPSLTTACDAVFFMPEKQSTAALGGG